MKPNKLLIMLGYVLRTRSANVTQPNLLNTNYILKKEKYDSIPTKNLQIPEYLLIDLQEKFAYLNN